MKSKLILLNVVLLGLLGWVFVRFRQVDAAVREREARVLGQRIVPEKSPPLPASPLVPVLTAANYLDVAEHMLFAKDRNPSVIIDPVPVEQKPPMPPMPVVHGLMLLGEPGIILSERPGAMQRTYRKGEKVGAFKLLAFDTKHVVLDWNGEKVDKTVEELLERTTAPPESQVAGAAAAPATAVAPITPPAGQPVGPGAEIGGGIRACQPNDSLPSGAVQGGYRKIEIPTPFGKSCRWEAVK